MCVLEVCILIDSLCYGTFTVTPLNFYLVNVTHNVAALFGVHPWHWNLTQGLPAVLGLYAPLLAYGLLYCRLPVSVWWLAALSAGYAAGLSVVSPHQEIRFLLPCLPFLHIIVGLAVRKLGAERATTGVDAPLERKNSDNASRPPSRYFSAGRVVCGLIGAVHLGGIFFLLRYHQSGTESAMLYVSKDLLSTSRRNCSVVVHVLAPCYSFPGYSFVHTSSSITHLNMLSCDPR